MQLSFPLPGAGADLGTPPSIPGLSVRRLRNRRYAEAAALAAMIARERGVSAQRLFSPTRGDALTAQTRQLTMYLLHVVTGRNLTEVAEVFGRDRSTASYACARIEDKRDLPAFDALVERLEARVAEQFEIERSR